MPGMHETLLSAVQHPLPTHTLLLSGPATATTPLENGSVPSLKRCEMNAQ